MAVGLLTNTKAFREFVEFCREVTDNDSKVILFLEKKFKRASDVYLASDAFGNLIESTKAKIKSNRSQKYVYIKDIVAELKAYGQKQTKDSKKSDEESISSKKSKKSDNEDIKSFRKSKSRSSSESKELTCVDDCKVPPGPCDDDCKVPPGLQGSSPTDQHESTVADKVEDQLSPCRIILDHKSPSENVPMDFADCLGLTPKGISDKKRVTCTRVISKLEAFSTATPVNCSQVHDGEDSSNVDGGEIKAGGKASDKQIHKLEKLLEAIHKKITVLEEEELDIDDLGKEDSNYIYIDKYKAKFMKVWKRWCEVKGRDTSTGRTIERRFCYEGTRYKEINRKVEKFINHTKKFPDYHNIRAIINQQNKKHHLKLNKNLIDSLAKDVFTEVGNKLQERRQEDLVADFGCHLTDKYKTYDDPAMFDKELRKKLDANKVISKTRIDEVLTKFSQKQMGYVETSEDEDDDDEEEETENDSDRPKTPCLDEIDSNDEDADEDEEDEDEGQVKPEAKSKKIVDDIPDLAIAKKRRDNFRKLFSKSEDSNSVSDLAEAIPRRKSRDTISDNVILLKSDGSDSDMEVLEDVDIGRDKCKEMCAPVVEMDVAEDSTLLRTVVLYDSSDEENVNKENVDTNEKSDVADSACHWSSKSAAITNSLDITETQRHKPRKKRRRHSSDRCENISSDDEFEGTSLKPLKKKRSGSTESLPTSLETGLKLKPGAACSLSQKSGTELLLKIKDARTIYKFVDEGSVDLASPENSPCKKKTKHEAVSIKSAVMKALDHMRTSLDIVNSGASLGGSTEEKTEVSKNECSHPKESDTQTDEPVIELLDDLEHNTKIGTQNDDVTIDLSDDSPDVGTPDSQVVISDSEPVDREEEKVDSGKEKTNECSTQKSVVDSDIDVVGNSQNSPQICQIGNVVSKSSENKDDPSTMNGAWHDVDCEMETFDSDEINCEAQFEIDDDEIAENKPDDNMQTDDLTPEMDQTQDYINRTDDTLVDTNGPDVDYAVAEVVSDMIEMIIMKDCDKFLKNQMDVEMDPKAEANDVDSALCDSDAVTAASLGSGSDPDANSVPDVCKFDEDSDDNRKASIQPETISDTKSDKHSDDSDSTIDHNEANCQQVKKCKAEESSKSKPKTAAEIEIPPPNEDKNSENNLLSSPCVNLRQIPNFDPTKLRISESAVKKASRALKTTLQNLHCAKNSLSTDSVECSSSAHAGLNNNEQAPEATSKVEDLKETVDEELQGLENSSKNDGLYVCEQASKPVEPSVDLNQDTVQHETNAALDSVLHPLNDVVHGKASDDISENNEVEAMDTADGSEPDTKVPATKIAFNEDSQGSPLDCANSAISSPKDSPLNLLNDDSSLDRDIVLGKCNSRVTSASLADSDNNIGSNKTDVHVKAMKRSLQSAASDSEDYIASPKMKRSDCDHSQSDSEVYGKSRKNVKCDKTLTVEASTPNSESVDEDSIETEIESKSIESGEVLPEKSKGLLKVMISELEKSMKTGSSSEEMLPLVEAGENVALAKAVITDGVVSQVDKDQDGGLMIVQGSVRTVQEFSEKEDSNSSENGLVKKKSADMKEVLIDDVLPGDVRKKSCKKAAQGDRAAESASNDRKEAANASDSDDSVCITYVDLSRAQMNKKRHRTKEKMQKQKSQNQRVPSQQIPPNRNRQIQQNRNSPHRFFPINRPNQNVQTAKKIYKKKGQSIQGRSVYTLPSKLNLTMISKDAVSKVVGNAVNSVASNKTVGNIQPVSQQRLSSMPIHQDMALPNSSRNMQVLPIPGAKVAVRNPSVFTSGSNVKLGSGVTRNPQQAVSDMLSLLKGSEMKQRIPMNISTPQVTRMIRKDQQFAPRPGFTSTPLRQRSTVNHGLLPQTGIMANARLSAPHGSTPHITAMYKNQNQQNRGQVRVPQAQPLANRGQVNTAKPQTIIIPNQTRTIPNLAYPNAQHSTQQKNLPPSMQTSSQVSLKKRRNVNGTSKEIIVLSDTD